MEEKKTKTKQKRRLSQKFFIPSYQFEESISSVNTLTSKLRKDESEIFVVSVIALLNKHYCG